MSMENILSIQGISKQFPGVNALDDVFVDFKKGEVHGIVGENGAGKSTLMKILSGVIEPDKGKLLLNNKETRFNSPKDSLNKGISIIFQEFNLIDVLSVGENIFLDRLKKDRKTIDWSKVYADSSELLSKVGLNINPTTMVSELSVAQKQMVEIAKALSFNSKIIIMDEPSATLTESEVKKLFSIIENLKKQEVTVIYISHKLEEVFTICDRVSVLRDGKLIETHEIKDINKDDLIQEMIGREISDEYPKKEIREISKEEVLRVSNLCRRGIFESVSFNLNKGEVLGLAGLVGSGRTEIARAIFGADKLGYGDICINDELVNIKNPEDAISKGISLITEDRKEQGLILNLSIANNISISNLNRITNKGFINDRKERHLAKKYIDELQIKTPSFRQDVINLSGGNQQKVVISKWLETNSNIFIMDEPTRGIDVGSKYEIYTIMNQLIQNGKSIILISSDLPELLAMSDRIVVINEGRIKGELEGDAISASNVMGLIVK